MNIHSLHKFCHVYNSELWTVTKQMDEKINAFRRRQFRIILNRT